MAGKGKVKIPTCVNNNECTTGNSSCSPHANCHDTIGSFACSCKPGWSGNGTHCSDINECLHGACLREGAKCNNTLGSYECIAQTGYTRDAAGNMVDIDECNATATNTCSGNATCINNEGSYWCRCKSGWVGDGVRCVDENECVTRPNPCALVRHGSAKCENTDGSFNCVCAPGFSAQNQSDGVCRNVNECLNTSIACNTTKATCVDNVGSFWCHCKLGYFWNTTLGRCEDVDECKGANPDCIEQGQNCSNTDGSYECACAAGFNADVANITNNTISCSNVDECANGTHNCHANATCADSFGSFSCSCNKGLVGDGLSCNSYDMCMFKTDNCDKNADCHGSTNGTYTCTCRRGFEGNGTNCSDVNECLTNYSTYVNQSWYIQRVGNVTPGNNTCHSTYGNCTNTEGSYICTCMKGFMGTGTNCLNIDECELGLHDCQNNSVCVDTQGSFECPCKSGFNLTLEGGWPKRRVCKDLDECYINMMARKANASFPKWPCDEVCLNTIGSFQCGCNRGYVINYDLNTCKDLDECSTGRNTCSKYAYCTNTAGSYTCKCKPGYSGTGNYSNCTDIDECAISNKTVSTYSNPSTNSNTSTAANKTACGTGAVCVNTVGSFKCECVPGYWGDGNTCTNIDECAKSIDNCFWKKSCTDTVGSFICKCPEGFRNGNPKANGTVCIGNQSVEVGMINTQRIAWTEVKFKAAFNATPVVITQVQSTVGVEVIGRVRYVSKTGFHFAFGMAATGNKTHDKLTMKWLNESAPPVSYIAAIPGNHSLPDGTAMVVGRAAPKGNMRRKSPCYSDTAMWWEDINFGNRSAPPIILAQILENDDINYAGGPTKAFCQASVYFSKTKDPGNGTARVGRLCPGMKSEPIKTKEKIGWIVVNQNTSNFSYDTPFIEHSLNVSFTSIAHIAVQNNVQGNGTQNAFSLNKTFNASPIVFIQKLTKNPFVVGWGQYEGSTTGEAKLRVFDDKCDLQTTRQEYVNLLAVSEAFNLR
eukprot:TRINITY_DN78936_c0_g1_i1.p1 TRINITY_DN78936_c0_g1~~TRINITY_DN78936_c0_g1_i1.p1  ORF type:complete len:1155 (+),score=147.67 TRINITY_DN78936_c0_g1_i1:493-3465(+)